MFEFLFEHFFISYFCLTKEKMSDMSVNPLLNEPLVVDAIQWTRMNRPLEKIEHLRNKLRSSANATDRLNIHRKLIALRNGMTDEQIYYNSPLHDMHITLDKYHHDADTHLRELFMRHPIFNSMNKNGIIPTRSKIKEVEDVTNDALKQLHAEYINWFNTEPGEFAVMDKLRAEMQARRPRSIHYLKKGEFGQNDDYYSEWHSDADLTALSNLLSSSAHYPQSQQDSGTPAPFFNALHQTIYGHEL